MAAAGHQIAPAGRGPGWIAAVDGLLLASLARPAQGCVRVPGSKSVTHRALVLAALARGESCIGGALRCDDTARTMAGLRALGVGVRWRGERLMVQGRGGAFEAPADGRPLDLGGSGSSLRFLLPLSALAPGRRVLGGSARLCRRPLGALVEALGTLGARLRCLGAAGCAPVQVEGGGLCGGRAGLPGGRSSQFGSALLLAAAGMERGLELEIAPPVVSAPYLALSVALLRRFGLAVERAGRWRFVVAAGQHLAPRRLEVEGDLSSAAPLWAAAAVTGGRVRVEGVRPLDSPQGDRQILELLGRMGCRVAAAADGATVEGGALCAVDLDLGATPDLVPTLAAVALFAAGTTRIGGVAHLRHKESNRLGAIATEWRKLGARIEARPDGLVIHGGRRLAGGVIDPHGDHRLAMAAAVIGLRTPGVVLRTPGCVDKSFPGFWNAWQQLVGPAPADGSAARSAGGPPARAPSSA